MILKSIIKKIFVAAFALLVFQQVWAEENSEIRTAKVRVLVTPGSEWKGKFPPQFALWIQDSDGNFSRTDRTAYIAVFIGNAVSFAYNFAFTLIKLLGNEPIQLFRVNFKLSKPFDVNIARNNILNCEGISLRVAFNRLAYVKLSLLVFHLAEVHFYLIINTPRSIRRKPVVLRAVERFCSADKPDCAD